jgi:hypothetical protein
MLHQKVKWNTSSNLHHLQHQAILEPAQNTLSFSTSVSRHQRLVCFVLALLLLRSHFTSENLTIESIISLCLCVCVCVSVSVCVSVCVSVSVSVSVYVYVSVSPASKRRKLKTIPSASASASASPSQSPSTVDHKSQSTTAASTTAASTSAKSKQLLSSMPLMLPKSDLSEKLMVIQLQDQSLDLSGDVGAIGRLRTKKRSILLDIKGKAYKGTVVPTPSFLLVGIGGKDAKIESFVNQMVLLDYESSVFDSETHTGVLPQQVDVDADYDVNAADEESNQAKSKRGRKRKQTFKA